MHLASLKRKEDSQGGRFAVAANACVAGAAAVAAGRVHSGLATASMG